MNRFEAYKLVKGTANTYIFEDPVQGSNGTAVVTRINNFIDVVGESFLELQPQVRGGITTLNTRGELEDIVLGQNKYCLVVDTSTTTGLAYQERVDLNSNQSIGGVKTFTGRVNLQVGGESGGVFNFLSDVNIQGTNSTTNLVVNNGTLLKGSTTQEGNLTVKAPSVFKANSIFEVNQTVQGTQLIGGSLEVGGSSSLGQNLSVGANTTIGGMLNVTGVSNFLDSLTVNKDLYIQRSGLINKDLTVNEDLIVLGTTNIKSDTTIGGGLIVAGAINSSSVSTTGLLDIGTTLKVKGESSLEGSVMMRNGLGVRGNTNLDQVGINQGLKIEGSLSVKGGSELGDLKVEELEVGGGLIVKGISDLRGEVGIGRDLLVEGGIESKGEVRVGRLQVEGESILRGEMSIEGNIEQTGEIRTEAVVTRGGIRAGGDIRVNGEVQAQGIEGNLVRIAGQLISTGSNILSDVEIGNSLTVRAPVYITGNVNINGNIQGDNLSGVNTGDEGKANSREAGVVYTTTDEEEPRVYTVEVIDNEFLHNSSLGMIVAPLNEERRIDEKYLPSNLAVERYERGFNGAEVVNNILIVNHQLEKRYISSVTIWSNTGEKVYPSLITAVSDNEMKIDFTDLPIEGEWYISITK